MVGRRIHNDAADALARLDPVLGSFIERAGPPRLRPPTPAGQRFAALARAICYQQLAGKAAASIHGRFLALFDGSGPTPEGVLALPAERLRSAGLSAAKTASILDLARRMADGEVDLRRAGRWSDAEVVARVTTVRGIGEWTAHMFLIFDLHRLDVWPTGDFGVRNGYHLLYRLPAMPSAKDLGPLGDRFRPYRSLAAWYCWRAVDTLTP
jgi:DNA-3-methyladenine glycosylase II